MQVSKKYHYVDCALSVRSPIARRFTDILKPAASQLSSLPDLSKRCLPASQFEAMMAELTEIVLKAYHALEADRAALAKRQAETKIESPLNLRFGPELKKSCRCYHPLAQVLFRMLRDLIELDERWCAFAWNADLAHTVTSPEQSEFEAYTTIQAEWIARVKQLGLEIRLRIKKLRESCRIQAAHQEGY